MDVTIVLTLGEGTADPDATRVYASKLTREQVEQLTAEVLDGKGYQRRAILESYNDQGQLTGFYVSYSNLREDEPHNADFTIGPEQVDEECGGCRLRGEQFTQSHLGCGDLSYEVRFRTLLQLPGSFRLTVYDTREGEEWTAEAVPGKTLLEAAQALAKQRNARFLGCDANNPDAFWILDEAEYREWYSTRTDADLQSDIEDVLSGKQDEMRGLYQVFKAPER